ncbi:ATP-binding cassette domain-containing protein [Pseudomonas sp. NPDC089569]|uniref:ATP-binding cassette domain-containing protein n=1 Tax=Pseudomonas sp. NPDC089569 TaxID=3390722 RepID=UPI003D07ACD2
MKKISEILKKNNWDKVTVLLRPKRAQLTIIMICTVTIYLTSLFLPLALQKGIDAALAHETDKLYWMLGFSIISTAIEIVFVNWRLITIVNLGAYLDFILSARVIKIILSRSYTSQKFSSGLILTTTNQIQNIKNFILHTIPQSTLDIGLAIISFLIIFNFHQPTALLVAGILFFSTLPLKAKSSKLQNDINSYNNLENKKQTAISSLAFSLKNIKYHGLESFLHRKTLQHLKLSATSLRQLLHTSRAIQAWSSITSRTLTLAVLISGCIAVRANELTFGEFMIIQILASRLNSLIVSTSEIISKYQEAKATLTKIQFLYDLPAEQTLEKFKPADSDTASISLSNISSRHQTGNIALDNVSFKVSNSGLIVLAGVSGSGKSTLANTLLGIYGVSSGDIHYYGKNTSTLDTRDIRKLFSVTDQDNYIFSGTIRENLCCGRKISDDAIFHTLERVGLKSLVESLPGNLEYPITENGRELSGGQKQRICLARAFLKGNRIYILDEPTSALDSEASAGVVRNLLDMRSDNLVICITHDPKIMNSSDKIILMHEGSIHAIGSHFELIESCPEYKYIYNSVRK